MRKIQIFDISLCLSEKIHLTMEKAILEVTKDLVDEKMTTHTSNNFHLIF
jgi:hypothetical protein